jgi:hypothetical protein
MADRRRDKLARRQFIKKIHGCRSGNNRHGGMFVRSTVHLNRTRQEKINASSKAIADHGFGCGFDGRINADAVCSS